MEYIKRYHYSGVDIDSTDLSYDESDERFIYKAFAALCNYAEDQLRCAGCPLSHICFSDQGNRFWERVINMSQGGELR